MTDSSSPSDVLTFYRANQVSPVGQSIADLPAHFRRRRSLYQLLGIAPTAVRGRRVIEFGPGSGHNPLYTAALRPAAYVLVDGNETGIAETKALLDSHGLYDATIRQVRSLFTDVPATPDFDLVLCEGVTNIQKDPAELVRHIAGFVAPGGVLLVTCVDSISFLSEICRRLLARLIAPPDEPLVWRLEKTRPYMAAHAETLPGMSRLSDHWIIDVLLAPRLGRFWAVDEAIELLDGDFDVLSASPRFWSDWRWYKTVNGVFNAPVLSEFQRWRHALIDYRQPPAPAEAAEVGRLAAGCATVCDVIENVIATPGAPDLEPVLTALAPVRESVAALAPGTLPALDDFRAILESWRCGRPPRPAQAFAPWFGRGQQYLSFVRRDETT